MLRRNHSDQTYSRNRIPASRCLNGLLFIMDDLIHCVSVIKRVI